MIHMYDMYCCICFCPFLTISLPVDQVVEGFLFCSSSKLIYQSIIQPHRKRMRASSRKGVRSSFFPRPDRYLDLDNQQGRVSVSERVSVT